jgi:DNA-binding transcriptional LysR family regulator
VVVLPESHAQAAQTQITLADLAEEPFITYPAHHRSVVHDAVLDACQVAGFTPQATEVAETSTLVSFVAAGLGVALVPASVQHLRITGSVYRPLAGTTPTVELAVATRPGGPDTLRPLRSQSRPIMYFTWVIGRVTLVA